MDKNIIEIIAIILNIGLTAGVLVISAFVKELVSQIKSIIKNVNENAQAIAVLDEIQKSEEKSVVASFENIRSDIKAIKDDARRENERMRLDFANSVKQLQMIFENNKS